MRSSLCFLSFFLISALTGAVAQIGHTPPPPPPPPPMVGNCSVYPIDDIWNTPITTLPVNAKSATWISAIGPTRILHADFGPYPYGIPDVQVPGTQPKVPVTFILYGDESDPGPYAIPPNAPVEVGSDHHVISIDIDNCILYELWDASVNMDGSWNAGSGAIFDFHSYALRPAGWTSADAAGLPIFPGLVRYDEVAAGAINHAIRITVPHTRKQYLWPARHYASRTDYSYNPPMGVRLRLKASYNISSFSPANRVILTALKRYGAIIADNGSPWFITGETDPRWDQEDLHQLGRVTGQFFEAVDESSLQIDPNSSQARQPH